MTFRQWMEMVLIGRMHKDRNRSSHYKCIKTGLPWRLRGVRVRFFKQSVLLTVGRRRLFIYKRFLADAQRLNSPYLLGRAAIL